MGQRIRPNSLDAAAKKITEIYKEDGYFDVEVDARIEVPTDTLVRTGYARDVVFAVEENEKFRLKNIEGIFNVMQMNIVANLLLNLFLIN